MGSSFYSNCVCGNKRGVAFSDRRFFASDRGMGSRASFYCGSGRALLYQRDSHRIFVSRLCHNRVVYPYLISSSLPQKIVVCGCCNRYRDLSAPRRCYPDPRSYRVSSFRALAISAPNSLRLLPPHGGCFPFSWAMDCEELHRLSRVGYIASSELTILCCTRPSLLRMA